LANDETGKVDTTAVTEAAEEAAAAGADAMNNPTAPTTPEPESGNETNN
jgi:hypothetical protein